MTLFPGRVEQTHSGNRQYRRGPADGLESLRVDHAAGPREKESLHYAVRARQRCNAERRAFAAGESLDIAQVMMTAEKANLSMQFAVAVRNKVVESYQEIMRMPI